MLLFWLSLLQACVLHSVLFLSSFMQASSSSSSSSSDDNDGDWSLFAPLLSTEDSGVFGTAAEQADVPPLQSTGDVYMDFSGSNFFPPSDLSSLPDDISIPKPDLTPIDNDFVTDCRGNLLPSAEYSIVHKRDNNNDNLPGLCQSPAIIDDPNDPKPDTNNNDNLYTPSPAPAIDPDFLHTLFNDELAHSKTMEGNPCAEIYHVLCCLGPRSYFVNIQRCDFFAGAQNCLWHEGAGIYCCLEVAFAGIGTWALVGRFCE